MSHATIMKRGTPSDKKFDEASKIKHSDKKPLQH